MRSRSIEYFLSQRDVEVLNSFIHSSVERSEKYDGRIRMAPRRLNTDELQKLYILKLNEWDSAVKAQVPGSSYCYLDLIRQGGVPCPIEGFLKALMQVIEQAIPASRFQGVVEKLETGLVECEFLCSCPSEPKDG